MTAFMSIEARSGTVLVAAGGQVWLLDCCVSRATSAVSDTFADFNDVFSVVSNVSCAANV